MLRTCLVLLLSFFLVLPAAAQVGQTAGTQMTYGETVNGALTNEQFFNLWSFVGAAGDRIEARMSATDGLMPLVGILDPGGELIGRSEDGIVNGLVTLDFTLPDDGGYTLVATRVDRDLGTTTGAYTLSLRLTNAEPSANDPYQDVTFRCQEYEVATALTLELSSDLVTPDVPYRINVYGLDGFQTLVHLTSTANNPNLCRHGDDHTSGDMLLLPDETPVIVAPEMTDNSFELTVTNPQLLATLMITIGSVDSSPGRYVAVISGLAIDTPGQRDVVIARVGPLAAAQGDVRVYMVADDNANSRLDPYIQLLPDETGCDDAGRRGCEDVPSFAGAGVRLADELSLIGDRFDAGVRLRSDDLDQQVLQLGSYSGNTSGRYALVIIGDLPPRP